MTPDDFRLQLNNLIQNLRNVSWLVQKQKSSFPDFGWYNAWVEAIADDALMRWVKKSRNRIVKEADLELLSQAKASLILDWLNEVVVTLDVPPRRTTQEILALLRTRWNGMPGVLTVERQWIDKALPGIELLRATAHAYGQCAHLLAAAHVNSGATSCNVAGRTRECVTGGVPDGGSPDCMLNVPGSRRLHVALATGTELEESHVRISAESKPTEDPYGALDIRGDAIRSLPAVFEYGQKVLRKDGYHHTYGWIFRGDSVVSVVALMFGDQNGKYLSFRDLADEVRLRRGDSVLVVGETWMALLDNAHTAGIPARERPDRIEALGATAVSRDGRVLSWTQPFFRDESGEIIFEDHTVKSDSMQTNSLMPVIRMWEQGL
ncbi:hypothetical protein [Motilibacter aurantiacus]|uniref:hypothetical protein n=1 Tax=Motilibacter aurantiacus TaxID=2714955 RepID=UPI00140D057D|nr:hypothetical protein [Motilibacter aurantiacus]NHC44552.1 hypothetical protein [Motilibacter aurantiacus]